MLAVPAVTPLTMPFDEPTVATAVFELVQIPPVVASVKVVVPLVPTVVVPIIDTGIAFTVTTVVTVLP